MTCKDCIHYGICIFHHTGEEYKKCFHFKPKSRYIELPCAVGDTVYCNDTVIWEEDCYKCEHFRVGGMGDPHECARTNSPFKHPDCTEIEKRFAKLKDILIWLAFDDFGKTVFLTKEEAEKALKEKQQ